MSRFGFDDAGGDAYGGGVVGDVAEDHGVGADFGVVADGDGAEDFGSRADVDVAADGGGDGGFAINADGDLLVDEAIGADFGIRMDDDAVGMGEEEAAGDVGVQGNVGTGDDGPAAVAEDVEFAGEGGEGPRRDFQFWYERNVKSRRRPGEGPWSCSRDQSGVVAETVGTWGWDFRDWVMRDPFV